jgi:uncharacterized membrane protein (UPF0182 family)
MARGLVWESNQEGQMLSFFIFLTYVACLLPIIISAKKHVLGKKHVIASALLAGVLTVLLICLRIYTEVLWYVELGQVHRYWVVFEIRVVLFLVGFGISTLFFGLNSLIARSGLPREAVRRLAGAHQVYMLYGLVVSIFLGNMCSRWWETVLLYFNRVQFGVQDPVFGKDLSFFVFGLPFFSQIRSYILSLLIFATLGLVIIYLAELGLQFADLFKPLRMGKPAGEEKRHTVFRFVTHFSIQGVLFVGLFIYQTALAIWNLVYSQRGAVFGAGYTDVHVQIGAYRFFMAALAVVGLAFLMSAVSRSRKRTFSAAGIAIVTLVGTWIIGVQAVPAIVQQYVVSPNEVEKERPYIEYNIEFTRKAFGLDSTRISGLEFPVKEGVGAENLDVDAATLQSIRLWDWRVLEATYNQNQSFRLYYRFMDVDIDRYQIGGRPVQVMLSARELDQRRLAEKSKTWQNMRLVYTHGYGGCLNPVNVFTQEGLPEYWVKDIPPVSRFPELKLDRPEIYFGEAPNSHVFVKTTHAEFDYPRGAENVTSFYEGKGGIPLGGGLRKLALALRFDGLRLLTAKELGPESRIMFRRPIRWRVTSLAPFLAYDNDPYQVIADGRIWFVWDAYTVSDHYPYAERYWYRANKTFGINYIRNSVKAVVNTYDGTVDFYVFEESDPIIQAYAKAFPGLFKSYREMPDFLLSHIRYPEDFLRIQAEMYATYHMNDPTVFYNREDAWQVARETYQGDTREVLPYYVVIKVPGETDPEFIQMIPFTPLTTDAGNPKHNMVAWMAGRCEGEQYGRILVYNFPKERLVYGPMQVEIRINQDDLISKDFTLWNQQGSRVIQGNLLVIPLSDNRILYVEPVYLQATVGKMPELKRVIAASGDALAYANSFEEALAQLVGRSRATEVVAGVTAVPTTREQIRLAAEHFRRYQQLTGQGRISEAGAELEKLREALDVLMRTTER